MDVNPDELIFDALNHGLAGGPLSAMPQSRKLTLLPGWSQRLAEVPAPAPPPALRQLPRSVVHYAAAVHLITSATQATDMLALIHQRSVTAIGLDTEFRYDRPGVVLNKKSTAYDVRSLRPLLLSLAVLDGDGAGTRADTLYRFVVDVRSPAVLPALHSLLEADYCFVGHFLQAEVLCLLRLGLPVPRRLWDTWVYERASALGKGHKSYKLPAASTEEDEARAEEGARAEEEARNTLVGTCLRHGVVYPFAGDKERLQCSFLDHPDGAVFTDEQIEYAAADAVAAAHLYAPQVAAAARADLLQHLVDVEMPWVSTNARMMWTGYRTNQELCARVGGECQAHRERLQPQLIAHGIDNVRSPTQMKAFFERVGLLPLFQKQGKACFDKDRLEAFADRHPAIPLIRAARRVLELEKGHFLSQELVGVDGRVHSHYRQLGTHTGRQTSQWPNVLGLGRLFRPLIVPDAGRGLGEVDLSQIEVGIAAAVYHEPQLVAMFNGDDVYSSMAKDFYRHELPAADLALGGREFKKKHDGRRARMKICTLGIIYGLTVYGLAQRLNVSEGEAQALLDRFLGLFPALKAALDETAAFGAQRGHVGTMTGLRRYRARPGAASSWERNWMVNHRVQASAAVVFKVAGNRLDKLYRKYDAWLLVPLHDAYVFEAPLGVLAEVASLTEHVMCEVVQEYFPQLQPRAEVNITHPHCWNKDGHADSVERWLEDPLFAF